MRVLIGARARSVCLVARLCLTLQPLGLLPARLLCPWDFPGKNTGVGCHFLLQGIVTTQELNLCLQQVDSLPLSHPSVPKYLRQNFYRSPEFLVLGVFFSFVLCPTDSSNFAFRGSQIHLHSSELPPACLGGFLVSHSLQRLTDLL